MIVPAILEGEEVMALASYSRKMKEWPTDTLSLHILSFGRD
jgi:hypothetical protein